MSLTSSSSSLAKWCSRSLKPFENIFDSYPLCPSSSSAIGSRKCSSPQSQRTDEFQENYGDTVHDVINDMVTAVEEEENVVVVNTVLSYTICDVVGDTVGKSVGKFLSAVVVEHSVGDTVGGVVR
jgi:hypothetical protein